MVGAEYTGEGCSVKVNQGNTVEIGFLGDAVIPLVGTDTENNPMDSLVGALGSHQVLIVQHRQGEVVSVTQTVYDRNGDVVYGRSGVGEFIRACDLAMTSSERLAGRKNCSK